MPVLRVADYTPPRLKEKILISGNDGADGSGGDHPVSAEPESWRKSEPSGRTMATCPRKACLFGLRGSSAGSAC